MTDKLSQKLFGSGPALNKLITLSQNGRPSVTFRVSGVVKDQPKTYKYISFFTSMSSEGYAEYLRSDGLMNEWAGQNFFFAVARLSPGHDLKSVEKKMNTVLQKYGADDLKSHSMEKTLFLFPLGDYYLKLAMGHSPRITYLYVIGSIALFILLIACINFMNLSTARAGKRATEIGIRKVMGAYRSTLVRHILTEAMVVVFASLLISLVLVEMSLPAFNTLTDKTITLNSGNALYFIASLIALAITTGLLAGSYPAFYVSSFQPARILKGNFSLANSSGWLRRSLVVFQFVIAIALVSGMIVITRQLDYIQNKDLGFDASARIVLPLRTAEAKQQYENLRRQLRQDPAINAVSAANYAPGMRIFTDGLFYTEGGNMNSGVPASLNAVDQGYSELLEMKLLAGRTFTDNRQMESVNKLVINRTAARKFGFGPAEAVGQPIYRLAGAAVCLRDSRRYRGLPSIIIKGRNRAHYARNAGRSQQLCIPDSFCAAKAPGQGRNSHTKNMEDTCWRYAVRIYIPRRGYTEAIRRRPPPVGNHNMLYLYRYTYFLSGALRPVFIPGRAEDKRDRRA